MTIAQVYRDFRNWLNDWSIEVFLIMLLSAIIIVGLAQLGEHKRTDTQVSLCVDLFEGYDRDQCEFLVRNEVMIIVRDAQPGEVP